MTSIKRIILFIWWAFFVWLCTHKSGHPEILGRYSYTYIWVLVGALGIGLGLSWFLLRESDSERPPFLQQLKSWSLALVFGIVFGVLATELLIRSFDVLGASFYHEITQHILDLEADPHAVYRLKPGSKGTYQDVEVRTNSLGFRDEEVTEREPGEFRILVLGDSVAFGWGVEQEEIFPRLLQEKLSAKADYPVRVINSAVIGYNTQQELAVLQSRGLDLSPDLILLVYVDNDVHPAEIDVDAMREKWNEPEDGNAFLLKYSWLYRIYYHVVPYLIGGKSNQLSVEGLNSSMEALRGIASISEENDIPLVVSFFRLTGSEVTNRLHTTLAGLSESNGFVYRDLLPLFEGRNIRQLTNSIIDIHPNAAGHELVADALVDLVAEARVTMFQDGQESVSGQQ